MNKKELQEAFQSIHASEGLLKEVLTMEDKKPIPFSWRPVIRWVTAVAVAAAIFFGALVFWPEGGDPSQPGIIAVPGVMKVYACELEGMSTEKLPDYELTDTKNFYRMISNPLLSGNFFTSLSFQIPEDYFGECKVTFGIFSEYE